MLTRALLCVPWLGPLASFAVEPSHCTAGEQTFFNCSVQKGKVASVCGSKEVTATTGYVQYRFGVPGKVELQFPATLAKTQRRFSLESHRPYQGESELLSFTVGKFEYSVYQSSGTDPTPFRSAGVLVSRANEGGATTYADIKCSENRTERISALAGIVPKAE